MSPTTRVRPPNVLLVVADDHRADCLGGDRIIGPATPTLDRMRRNGTMVGGARIGGGHNPAVCIPSRAALLTGCPPWQALSNPRASATVDNQRIRRSLTNLGEPFRAAGYQTHAVGKWHNDIAALNRGFAGGASLFFDGMSAHRNLRVHAYDPRGEYAETAARQARGFSTEVFADSAIAFLRGRRDRNQPFLLYLAFTSPHDPRTPPARFRDRYDSSSIALPDNFARIHPFDNGELRVRDELLAKLPRHRSTVRRHLADYYAMIEHHDHELGRVLQVLEQQGERENTIVVYTSDHGLAMGSHGLLGKQNLYEHSLKVPMILTGPGIQAGRTVTTPLPSYGLFPTLCELAAVPIPPTVGTASFAPVLTSREEAAIGNATPIFSHYRHIQRCVVVGNWKLITYDVGDASCRQLFDLDADPGEQANLVDLPQFRSITSRLQCLLDEWWQAEASPGHMVERIS